jgi:hypothetical protein
VSNEETPAWFQPGSLVDYIGTGRKPHRESPLGAGVAVPFTARVDSVELLPGFGRDSGRWVAFLEGHQGWFALDALVPTPSDGIKLPDEQPLTDADLDELEHFLERRPAEARMLGKFHRALIELRHHRALAYRSKP